MEMLMAAKRQQAEELNIERAETQKLDAEKEGMTKMRDLLD
jgi:hypothetical protein